MGHRGADYDHAQAPVDAHADAAVSVEGAGGAATHPDPALPGNDPGTPEFEYLSDDIVHTPPITPAAVPQTGNRIDGDQPPAQDPGADMGSDGAPHAPAAGVGTEPGAGQHGSVPAATAESLAAKPPPPPHLPTSDNVDNFDNMCTGDVVLACIEASATASACVVGGRHDECTCLQASPEVSACLGSCWVIIQESVCDIAPASDELAPQHQHRGNGDAAVAQAPPSRGSSDLPATSATQGQPGAAGSSTDAAAAAQGSNDAAGTPVNPGA